MDGKSSVEPDQQHDTSNVQSPARDPKLRPSPSSSSSPLPSPKRSRRSADKRVVSIPIAEASGSRAKGASESAPPSDSWAWRKYGQKPIKGSPYPRGYYRCSSLKGCPARKQVERSRVDPGMLVVTYSAEHNHSWPLPKSNNNSRAVPATAALATSVIGKVDSDLDSVLTGSDPYKKVDEFSDLIDPTLMAMSVSDDVFWYSDVRSNSSASPPDDTLLFGPMFGSAQLSLDDCTKSGGGRGGEEKDDDDDDVLFEGLGELPEYSVVFRRSYVERQMAAG